MESLVARLHAELGHPQQIVVLEALRRRGARPEIIRVAERWTCRACAESKPMPWRPVVGEE
eukprot:4265316-Prorocentrum_lima.AAC.1